MRGRFRLRSFHGILTFIGRSTAGEPEYDVQNDPRTPAITENPVSTLGILESKKTPSDGALSAKVNGYYYGLRPDPGVHWHRDAFRLLYSLFQMTVTELPQRAGPGITIAK